MLRVDFEASPPPFYVVIGKSNRHSRTFDNVRRPIYITPLPSVSIVGKGISIDTDSALTNAASNNFWWT